MNKSLSSSTPSEDGREVPEVVAWYLAYTLNGGKERVVVLDRPPQQSAASMAVSGFNMSMYYEPLMTVAQHERIVAAKDAEIARLTDELSDCDFRRRVAIQNAHDAAQPARQVGGDEQQRKADLFDQYAKEAEAAGFAGVGEWLDALQESLRLVTLARDAFDKRLTEWQQIAETEAENRMADRAALAPAADAWPKLEKKAQVGAGIFSAGLSSRLVVEAAYRQHEYSQQPEVEAERLEKFRSLFTPTAVVMQESSPCDVMDSTGNAEVDRIIGRLMSADPDFNDCTDAAMLLRRLVIEEINGPSGYSTWKDAATAERIKRVAMKPREEIVSLARDGIDMYPGPNMNERKLCDEIIRLDAAYSSDSKLDEVARLNRRAIPLELLIKLCAPQADHERLKISRLAAAIELRALLGKEGE